MRLIFFFVALAAFSGEARASSSTRADRLEHLLRSQDPGLALHQIEAAFAAILVRLDVQEADHARARDDLQHLDRGAQDVYLSRVQSAVRAFVPSWKGCGWGEGLRLS